MRQVLGNGQATLGPPGGYLINPPQHFHATGAAGHLVSTETMRWHFVLVPFILQSGMLERKESYGGNVDLCTNFAYCGHSRDTGRPLTLQRYVIQWACEQYNYTNLHRLLCCQVVHID